MKKVFGVPVIISLAIFCSCQKQQTEEERKTEVERQVQERLAAERQAQSEQQLAQREAELDAREKMLAEKQKAAESAPAVEASETPLRSSRTDTSGNVATASYSTFYRKLEPYGVWRETSSYGYVGNHARRSGRARGVLTPTAAGFTLMGAGLGYRKSRLAGQPTITGAGRGCATSAGFGCPEMNGRPRGYRGARVMIMSVGRRCHPKRVSIGAPVFITGLTIITISARTNTVSFRRINLARAVLRQPSCPPNET
jgi:hypothetical protein